MTGWNFERRRDTSAAFAIGVFVLTKGLPDKGTSLEGVRSRMKLSAEEGLFAARKLDEEGKIAFNPKGAVRSNARGIAHAETLMSGVRAKVSSFAEVERALAAGGYALAILTEAIRAQGDPVPCGGPADSEAPHRLALNGDAVVLEHQGADGTFAPVTPDESSP